MVERGNKVISVKRQCELLGINRGGLYYKPRPADADDHALRQLIDEEYTNHPFYGQRRMRVFLNGKFWQVGRVRIRRLMAELGLAAICPKRNLSRPGKNAKKYPYLLRDYAITRPFEVWSIDITYIRLAQGYAYLVAIIDWHSRHVVSWELSNTLDSWFCVEAAKRALSTGTPDIFNMDQGSQFTSEAFLRVFAGSGVQISMDGKGRALDNIFIERLWRTVKYEEVYPRQYRDMSEAREKLAKYFEYYNTVRPHQSLGYKTPEEVHFGRERSKINGAARKQVATETQKPRDAATARYTLIKA